MISDLRRLESWLVRLKINTEKSGLAIMVDD